MERIARRDPFDYLTALRAPMLTIWRRIAGPEGRIVDGIPAFLAAALILVPAAAPRSEGAPADNSAVSDTLPPAPMPPPASGSGPGRDTAGVSQAADTPPRDTAAPTLRQGRDPGRGRGNQAAPIPDTTARAAGDSGTADSAALGARFYEYIAHPVLQVLTIPVDLVLVPAVKALIFPAKPPLRYILREDVIDRTIQLISFGHQDQMMLYPTLNLAPGTGSYTGLTLRHRSLFGRPTEKLVTMGQVYVNGDWKLRGYVVAEELFGSGFESKTSVQLNRMKNTSIAQPGSNQSWAYADTSNVIAFSIGHRLVERLGAKATYTFRDNRYDKAPPGGDPLVSEFFRNEQGVLDPAYRGLEQDWHDHILSLGLFRDTRNNENIPLTGSDFKFNWNYHFTDASHDYHGWETMWTGFYKLGAERYEITSEEERKAGGMDVRKLLKQIEMRKLREQIFSRKVVALHAYTAQSYEVQGNRMPTYGLQTLGNDTPLRGYGGARFRDYTVAAVSAEYRFPVMRLMDGMIFNEYGVTARSWDKVDLSEDLRNSWGFGINVRRPDIFLFRVHAGFHGLHGIQLNISVDPYY